MPCMIIIVTRCFSLIINIYIFSMQTVLKDWPSEYFDNWSYFIFHRPLIEKKIRVLGEAGLSEAKFSETAETTNYYTCKVNYCVAINVS